MNPLYSLWKDMLSTTMETLEAKPYKLGKLWSRPPEEGYLLKLEDGTMKLEVMPPEKVQHGKLPACGMRVLLHFPASRRLRPIMLDYGEPKTKEDVQEALTSLSRTIAEHHTPMSV